MREGAVGPSRPPLRYFGGKWRLAPWIIQHFPAHKVYVTTDPLELSPLNFPPGTQIVVLEPVCPRCEQPRLPIPDVALSRPTPGALTWKAECDCGFNWDEWVAQHYS